jgi:hypothetical protein
MTCIVSIHRRASRHFAPSPHSFLYVDALLKFQTKPTKRQVHVLAYSMAAPKVADVPNRFHDFQQKVLEGLGRPTDRKQLVDDFPGFAVRCFLKDPQSATAVQPFQDPTFGARFPAASYWDLIEKFHENNCRYACLLSYLFIVRVAFSICLFLPLKFH